MNEFEYEEKIIAFLDILGFRNAINETIKSSKERKYTVDKIKNIFNEIDAILYEYWDISNITRFSDTILIIAPARFDYNIFTSIKKVQILLLENGLLLRGGIVKGDIYFAANENKYFDVFGPAINRAYELEQQAIYPRVLIDKSITEMLVHPLSFAGQNHTMSFGSFHDGLSLIKDFDEFYFLDYFSMIRSIRDKNKRMATISILDEMIDKNINNTDINMSKKYGWLKTHWTNIKNKNMVVDIYPTK